MLVFDQEVDEVLTDPLLGRQGDVAAAQHVVDERAPLAARRFYGKGGQIEWNHFLIFAGGQK